MANFLYDIAINLTFAKGVDWTSVSNNFAIVGVSSSYTPSAAHQHLSDIVSGDRITSPVTVSGCTFTGRTFKFSAALFPAVGSGQVISYVVLIINTGTDTTSTLLEFTDTATDLPATGTGADISFTPDPTTGLFSL